MKGIRRAVNRMRGLKLNVKFTLLITGILLVPISVFSIYIFHNMEDNSISEKENSVRYFFFLCYERILKNVDSINISTQFFFERPKAERLSGCSEERSCLYGPGANGIYERRCGSFGKNGKQ